MQKVYKRAITSKSPDGTNYKGVLDRYDRDPGGMHDGKYVSFAASVPYLTRDLAAYFDQWNLNRLAELDGAAPVNHNTRSERSLYDQYGEGQVIQLQNPDSKAVGNPKNTQAYGSAVETYRKRAKAGEDMKGTGKRHKGEDVSVASATQPKGKGKSKSSSSSGWNLSGTIQPASSTPMAIRNLVPTREGQENERAKRAAEVDSEEEKVG